MKVAQTGVSGLEMIQTPKFLKPTSCLKHVFFPKQYFALFYMQICNLSGLYDKFLQDDHGQYCITNIYTCPVLSYTGTYLHNAVQHTCITNVCQFATVYLRFNVPVNIFRDVQKDNHFPVLWETNYVVC